MKNTRYEVYPDGLDKFPSYYPIQKLQTAIDYAFKWSRELSKVKIVEFFDIGEGIKMGITVVEGQHNNKLYIPINKIQS